MDTLINELKTKIVNVLDLPNITPEDIDADAQFVGGDLGIDSIDVLELVMMIEKDYGVRIDNKDLGVRVFRTLGALAQYIHEQSPEYSQ